MVSLYITELVDWSRKYIVTTGSFFVVFDNGETRNLVCLDGTIPVMYKSNSYNIPMQFWMPINFPYERPLVFVRPTHQMVINPSNVVDSSGTVKLPYLDDWTYDRSNLINLIEILQENFAKKSPVYSKSINAAVNAANSSSTSKYSCAKHFSFGK